MASTERMGNGFRGVYYDAEKRRHKTPVRSTERKALREASDLEAKVRAGKWIDPVAGRVTFAEYFEKQWLPNRVMEAGTTDYYLSIYRATLKDEFGAMELRKILPSTVQGWIARLDKAGVKPATIKAKAKALQTILAGKRGGSALSDRLIEFNPCATMMLPTVVEPDVQIFTPDEAGLIFEAMPSWWFDLVVLDAETGLRWGELMGLRVGDFGLNYRTVTARRTIVETSTERSGNGTRFAWKDYPKGKRSREIGLRPSASEQVKLLVAERGLTREDRLLSMPDLENPALPRRTDEWPEGLPVSRAFFRQSVWIPALDKAGVSYRKFHAMRASHISWMLAGGATMAEVMERVGHREWDTTRRYVGRLPDADERNLSALDRIFKSR